jgi:hypothetical protein
MIVNRELVVEAQMIVVVAIELVQVLASLRGAPEMYVCMYVCMYVHGVAGQRDDGGIEGRPLCARPPVIPQSLPQTRRVAVVCAAPHGSVNIDCGAGIKYTALTMILEVGSVAEAKVEVHEL